MLGSPDSPPNLSDTFPMFPNSVCEAPQPDRAVAASQDRYVQLPQLSWPAVAKPLQLSGSSQAFRTPPAIFQRTSNPEVKAKAAKVTRTELNIILTSMIMMAVILIIWPRTPESLSGGSQPRPSRLGSFPLSARLWLLACHPARGPAELAGEWFHDVCTKLFCDTATALTSRRTENCLTLKLGSGFPGYWPKITMNVWWQDNHWTASNHWTSISKSIIWNIWTSVILFLCLHSLAKLFIFFQIYVFSRGLNLMSTILACATTTQWNAIRNTSKDWPGTVRTEPLILCTRKLRYFSNVQQPRIVQTIHFLLTLSVTKL